MTVVSRSNQPTKEVQNETGVNLWMLFFASCAISVLLFLLLGGGKFYWWEVVVVPIYALWLTAPVLTGETCDSRRDQLLGYIGWVVVQSVILFLGLKLGVTGPPEGAGVPHF